MGMTFEVLEPNWEEMIAKIRSGKVANVDQVLKIHDDFLTTCLYDCLLSNITLLTTVRKLLGICCDFSDYMQLARENYNEKILNILHRLDFNGYYSKKLDTFGGHSA